jgi:hypothetical protein
VTQAAKRRQADVRRRFDWWDTAPKLTVSLWPTVDGIKMVARYGEMDRKGVRNDHIVLEATWTPRECTEAKIVDWAQRGLAHYLAQLVTDRTSQ